MLMMSICKYSLFAFAYQDGEDSVKNLDKFEHRKQSKLDKLPSFFDFLGYCLFIPTALFNTPFDYMTYQTFMNKERQFKNIPGKNLLIKLSR
jgi:hypothetical protein